MKFNSERKKKEQTERNAMQHDIRISAVWI